MKRFKKSLIVVLTTFTVATLGVNVIPNLLGEDAIIAYAATTGTIRAINFNDGTPNSSVNIDVTPGTNYDFSVSASRSDVGSNGALDFRVVGTDGTIFGTAHFDGNTQGINTANISVQIPAEYTGKTVKVERVYTQASGITGLEKPTDQVWSSQTITATPLTPITPPTAQGTVTANYVDEKGNVLAPAVTQTGNVGEGYTTTAEKTLTVDGKTYELTATPANATGNFTAEAITVTYVYKEKDTTSPVTTSTVTANYVDEKGNVLAPAVTQTGNVGEGYTTTAEKTLTVDEKTYELTATPANATGKFTKEAITVTYIYKEKANTTPAKEDPKVTPTSTKKDPNATKKVSTLPKTGENYSILSGVLGTFVIAISTVVLFFKKKKA